MKKIIIAAMLFCSAPAFAQIVATTDRGIAVADHGVVTLYDSTLQRIWSVPALERVSSIVVGEDRIALLDSWGNQARVIRLADGSGTTMATGETPIGAVFHRRDLIVLERDSRTVSRIDRKGRRTALAVSPDPSFISASADRIYVYSRAAGLLQELDARDGLRLARTASLPPFASDLEVSGNAAYLLYPRDARLAAVNLETFDAEMTAAGGVPSDLAVIRAGSALSAPLIGIADPAAKRVWTTEGTQSVGAAFGRGFLRGLIGLGLFRPRSSEFPTGVDRIASAGGVTTVYDSTSGTLYRLEGQKSRSIGEGVAPQAFAISSGRVVVWRNDALHWAD